MAERNVYIVKGSEDGILGVYSTKGRAVDRGIEYASQDGIRELPESRGYYVSQLSRPAGSTWIEATNDNYGTVEITTHTLNY